MQLCLKKTSDLEKDLNPIEFDGLKRIIHSFTELPFVALGLRVCDLKS
jgi:hypothetical protein